MKCYIAIDLKSFYASVECVERGLNPLDALLTVADSSRTEKTICLAVSPALKAYGVPGRPRLFEVNQRIREVNQRRGRAGTSTSGLQLAARPDLAVDFIIAPPRMALYVDYSRRIYEIYQRHAAPEDIHIYSIDEVFIDATPYLAGNGLSPHDMAMRIIRDVLSETGITATAGIGTNMYLCKVAMDIVAKRMPPDADGVRIASLTEDEYRKMLWTHRPLTDFWRLGRGTARRLEAEGYYTMGDVARASLSREWWFYKEFGVMAELLIDHAWGYEPSEMRYVKAYRPESHSISSGQVLQSAYTVAMARNVTLEMADALALDLVEQGIVTDQITLTVGYDTESLTRPDIRDTYTGEVTRDHYGREVPRHAHGTVNFPTHTSSTSSILQEVAALYDRIVHPSLLVRRLTLGAHHLQPYGYEAKRPEAIQLSLFTDYDALRREQEAEAEAAARERRRQEAIVRLRRQYGKNIILSGINFSEGATQRDRNSQIGGHKA